MDSTPEDSRPNITEIAPGYNERLQAQNRLEEAMEKWEWNWFAFMGEYTRADESIVPEVDIVKGEDNFFTDPISGETKSLKGLEIYLRQMIKNLMTLKNNSEPVLILDVGGGVGLSWFRIAASFAKEVNEGKIAFIVSNFSFLPEQYLSRKGIVSIQEDKYLEKSRPLVHFLNGRFIDLHNQEIALPDGRILKLAKNVDLVHERSSLTAWSKVPERDIVSVQSLLSPIGLYMVRRVDTLEPLAPVEGANNEPLKEVLEDDEENIELEKQQRLQGIIVAHGLLQKYGLKRIDRVEGGKLVGERLNYVVLNNQILL